MTIMGAHDSLKNGLKCFYAVFLNFKAQKMMELSHRFYGVMVSTEDFESSDPGSNPGRTFFIKEKSIHDSQFLKRKFS